MKYSCFRLYCVIHKNYLLLNQHNGDDAPQNVEFYCKNKFEKLAHLVGFIIRMLVLGRIKDVMFLD